MHGPCIPNTQVGLLKRPQEGFTSVHQGVGLAACLLAGSLGTGTTGYVARQDALRNDEFFQQTPSLCGGNFIYPPEIVIEHISHDGQIAGSQKRNLTVFAFALEQIL